MDHMTTDDTDQLDETGGSFVLRLLGLMGLARLVAWVAGRRRCCVSGNVQWPDTPVWAADGALANVASFNSFVDTERPCYRHYPEAAAQIVLGMDPSGSRPQEAFVLAYHPGAGSGETDVVIILEIDGDDSVAAERYVLTFVDEIVVGGTPGVHRLVYGTRQFRCHPGRGQQNWATTPCL